jgi:uncharacterized RDD family membrane protein YckC
MSKQRFRDVKKDRVIKKIDTKRTMHLTISYASLGLKTKAFLTDVFMILMPLLYLVIYIIMGGLESASHEKLLSWTYTLIPYTIIISTFMIKDKGRSPGMRSQSLQVVNTITQTPASAFSIAFRNISFLLTLALPFVWILPFFRKDNKGLHDLLSATAVVITDDKRN